MRRLVLAFAAACAALTVLAAPAAADFPAADAGYHNDAEWRAAVDAVIAAHPGLVARTVIGHSFEGRELWAVKISDNVAVDEAEPEVLFTAGQHAREHLTVEMALYLIGELTSRYATDARVRGIVDTREIWVIPNVNPDGSEYDIADGHYRSWRKNRQPNPGSDFVGTDLNRNWGYRWGCCGGSTDDTSFETFRGAFPFSAPETAAVRAFVDSRVLGGVQQIKASIDFHAFSELILWPYGYTHADTAPRLGHEDRRTFATLATSMARLNGYHAEQSSDLYVTDGSFDDWLWATHRIYAFTFEMYPDEGSPHGFYPPDELIGRETARNRDAVLLLLEHAVCPPAAAGRACVPSTRLNAAKPSHALALAGGANFGLTFRYRATRRTSSVRLRVAGRTLFRERGRSGGWQTATVSLSRFAGRTVRIEFQRRDARVADVKVTRF